MATDFKLKDAISYSIHYNDGTKNFKTIVNDCYEEFFTNDNPKEKLSSWKNYYYLGDEFIIPNDSINFDNYNIDDTSSYIEIPGYRDAVVHGTFNYHKERKQGANTIGYYSTDDDLITIGDGVDSQRNLSITTGKILPGNLFDNNWNITINSNVPNPGVDDNYYLCNICNRSTGKIYDNPLRIKHSANIGVTLNVTTIDGEILGSGDMARLEAAPGDGTGGENTRCYLTASIKIPILYIGTKNAPYNAAQHISVYLEIKTEDSPDHFGANVSSDSFITSEFTGVDTDRGYKTNTVRFTLINVNGNHRESSKAWKYYVTIVYKDWLGNVLKQIESNTVDIFLEGGYDYSGGGSDTEDSSQ